MPNVRKILTAKAAWARLSAECRTLREALQRIARLTASARAPLERDVHREATAALDKTERDRAA